MTTTTMRPINITIDTLLFGLTAEQALQYEAASDGSDWVEVNFAEPLGLSYKEALEVEKQLIWLANEHHSMVSAESAAAADYESFAY